MLKHLIFAMAIIQAPSALAEGLSGIAGRYNYVQYAVTLSDGRELGFKELGAVRAELEIGESSIELTMPMADGTVKRQRASILSAELTPNAGHWVALWPDLPYPVRVDFTYAGDSIEYTTKFDNPTDRQRYGSAEYAHLKRFDAR